MTGVESPSTFTRGLDFHAYLEIKCRRICVLVNPAPDIPLPFGQKHTAPSLGLWGRVSARKTLGDARAYAAQGMTPFIPYAILEFAPFWVIILDLR